MFIYLFTYITLMASKMGVFLDACKQTSSVPCLKKRGGNLAFKLHFKTVS